MRQKDNQDSNLSDLYKILSYSPKEDQDVTLQQEQGEGSAGNILNNKPEKQQDILDKAGELSQIIPGTEDNEDPLASFSQELLGSQQKASLKKSEPALESDDEPPGILRSDPLLNDKNLKAEPGIEPEFEKESKVREESVLSSEDDVAVKDPLIEEKDPGLTDQGEPGLKEAQDSNTSGSGTLKAAGCFGRLKRKLSFFALKAALAGLIVLSGFFIYFDAVVMEEYEVDDKWVLPAVVYSRPLELYPEQRLSLEQMLYELELLKYRKVDSPSHPGEYAVNPKTNRLIVIKRPFSFPDGDENRMSLFIEFDGNRVERLANADTNTDLAYARMDPVLLDRINRIDPKEDRIFINLDEVPDELITTLLEIEDRRFYSHIGINIFAIGRAFIKNLLAGKVVEGGSTITQQLVKNYFLTSEKSYSRKLKELIMAMIMDHRYTKDQILEAYMNEIYLGQNGNAGIYGFGLASYFYFGVPVSELSLDRMALLVGLIKGPSYYDPWRRPENALNRRNTVLEVLRSRGRITEAEFAQYSARPLNVIERGSMNYSKTPAFMGVLKHEISSRFGPDFLSGNGIRIFTSLDPQAQAAAEKAVAEQLDEIEKSRGLQGLEAAMLVSSWRTAEVSAVVGSRTPKYDGFNRVIEGRRQIGSLVKPFVYLTAFNRGFHLGSIVQDSPLTVRLSDGRMWSPKNDDNKFRGPITVLSAMARSLNVPTVRIGMDSGLSNFTATLKKVGVDKDLPLYPSLLLGTLECTPYELNAMYASMATDGVYQNLTTLRTVVKDGSIVYEREAMAGERTLDPKDTYLTLYAMTEVTHSGTGRHLNSLFPGVVIASKTGTTNDSRDTWAVGMDSDELVTTWVGFDVFKPTGLYGSSGPLRVYSAYLKERGVNSLELNRPAGIKFVNFDRNGQIVQDQCRETGLALLPVREDKIAKIRPCYDLNVPYNPSGVPPAAGSNRVDRASASAFESSTKPDLKPSEPERVHEQQGTKPDSGDRTLIESQANDFERFLLGF